MCTIKPLPCLKQFTQIPLGSLFESTVTAIIKKDNHRSSCWLVIFHQTIVGKVTETDSKNNDVFSR